MLWRSHPVFIAHRTPDELKTLQDPKEVAQLRDPDSAVLQQPPYAKNWHRSVKPEYLVRGRHLHASRLHPRIPAGSRAASGRAGRADISARATARATTSPARVYQGVPAPYNLPVPPHRFVSDTVIRIGENPPGSTFDLNDVEQI